MPTSRTVTVAAAPAGRSCLLVSPHSTAESSSATPSACTIVGTGQRLSKMNDARSVPAARHVACGERGEKHADQAPPHIDGVAEDGRDDPAGDNLQRQQHCAAYKNGDFKDRSLPVSLPSLPGLPGLHTYNLWGSVLK